MRKIYNMGKDVATLFVLVFVVVVNFVFLGFFSIAVFGFCHGFLRYNIRGVASRGRSIGIEGNGFNGNEIKTRRITCNSNHTI